MNNDVVIFLLVALFWVISQAIAWLGRKARPQQADLEEVTPQQGQGRRGTLQAALRDLAKQMGVDEELYPEEPPTTVQPHGAGSEHRRTRTEHRRTASETRVTESEARMSSAEHRRTLSEAQRTSSEHVWSAPEHEWSQGEHVRGDLDVPPIPKLELPSRVPSSRFAARLKADLSSRNRTALARAIVLHEVLGPPVSLRPPTSDRF